MRFLAPGLVWSIVLSIFSGCSGSLGTGATGGSSGTGSGGTPGTGGLPGTGGVSGSGGSPGTVTLQIVLPAGQSFCDENPSCTSTQHLTIMNNAGQPLSLGAVGCGVSCSDCAAVPCPLLPVIACPAGNWGTAIANYSFVWDGSYSENDSCEPSGASLAVSCFANKTAPAGIYVAQFCATPGTLSVTDGGAELCTPTAPQSCAKVEFTFPASQPAVINLPNPVPIGL
jgi:hypothetical protein